MRRCFPANRGVSQHGASLRSLSPAYNGIHVADP